MDELDLTTTQRIWRNVAGNNDALLMAQAGLQSALFAGDERAQKQFGDQIAYLEEMMSNSIGPDARSHADKKNGLGR